MGRGCQSVAPGPPALRGRGRRAAGRDRGLGRPRRAVRPARALPGRLARGRGLVAARQLGDALGRAAVGPAGVLRAGRARRHRAGRRSAEGRASRCWPGASCRSGCCWSTRRSGSSTRRSRSRPRRCWRGPDWVCSGRSARLGGGDERPEPAPAQRGMAALPGSALVLAWATTGLSAWCWRVPGRRADRRGARSAGDDGRRPGVRPAVPSGEPAHPVADRPERLHPGGRSVPGVPERSQDAAVAGGHVVLPHSLGGAQRRRRRGARRAVRRAADAAGERQPARAEEVPRTGRTSSSWW